MTTAFTRLRTGLAALAVTGAAVGVLSAASPANAATAQSVTTAAGTAPGCVARYVAKPVGTIVLRNKCGKTMRVKVIVKRGPDSPCWTGFRPGQVRVWKWLDSTFASYQKTVTC
ncbi:hypothetical protein ACFOY2_17930 [Nonomuraea purpurea]|uniref:Uncharacterized protein n=1 Tax=Nonomuraea purpurea TaxID=1849276 RepID=A0ABV8G9Y7_9ACTN